MHKWLTLAAASSLVVLLLFAGCAGGLNPQAKRLLTDISMHNRKSLEEIKKLDVFYSEWGKLFEGEETEDTIRKAESLIDGAIGSVSAALGEVREMENDFRNIRELDVSSDMRKYCDMKVDALKEQGRALDLVIRGLEMRKELLRAYESGADIEELVSREREIEDVEKEAKTHLDKAKVLHEDANDYYREKRIGE